MAFDSGSSGIQDLLDLALLHQRFDSLLAKRGILSFEEGSWAIDSGFDLEIEEIEIMRQLHEKVEWYEAKYGTVARENKTVWSEIEK